ncbi:unnamed protein product [Closterium sp. NIES-64]|nr:unnamed protein product [Closterium sp. NIES-64]CAI5957211.1 unnamed protein product [Closterium sp. NIES-64]
MEEQGTRGKEKDPDWRPAPGEAAGTSGGSGDEGWGGRGGGQAGASGAAAKRPRTSGLEGSGAGGAGPALNSQPQGAAAAAGGSEGSGAAGAGTSTAAAGVAPLGGSAGAVASQRSDRAGRTPTDEELDPWTEEVLRNAEPGLVRGMFSEKDVKEARNCKICKKKISWKGCCTSTGKRHLKRSHYPSLQIWCRRFKDPNKPDNLTFPDGGWGPDVPDQTAWPWEHAATWPRIVQTPDRAVTGGSEVGGSRQMSMAAFVTPRVHGQQLREGLVQLFAAADLPFRLVECRERDIWEMADVIGRGRLDYLWAAAVAENDLAFRTSSSKAMQAFVDAVAAFGKAYTLPSAYKVAGPLLVKLKLDTEELIKPIKESWPRSGCTLTMDGWTCFKSRGMICVIAQNDTAPVIVDCVDSKTAKKTGEYLAKLIQHAICEVGDSHVVQVVMDNTANNKRVANLLKDEYPQVFFTNCAAHVLDLMLHDMGKVKAVKRVLNQVHRVVMMVKGSASAVTLFRELFSKLALVRPGATRFGTQVIMIERFLEVKKALKEMVISEEWKSVAVANTEEGQAIRGLLLEETFWDSVTAILGLMKPIYEVLRIVDRQSLAMGSVYGLMLEATVKTNEAVTKAAAQLSKKTGLLPGNEKAAFLAAFKAIIANRWDGQLHNPLHALGWLLNPKNQYVGEIREDVELRAGAEEVFKARGGSVEMRTMLVVQLAAFHKGEGKLGSVDARWAATILVESGRLSAAEWWALYGGEVRAL